MCIIETLRTIDILGKDGGLIIAPSQEVMNNVPVENVLAFMKAVKEARGESIDQKKEMRSGMQKRILEMEDISIQFPGVLALDHARFDLDRGEVHVLLGKMEPGNQPS